MSYFRSPFFRDVLKTIGIIDWKSTSGQHQYRDKTVAVTCRNLLVRLYPITLTLSFSHQLSYQLHSFRKLSAHACREIHLWKTPAEGRFSRKHHHLQWPVFSWWLTSRIVNLQRDEKWILYLAWLSNHYNWTKLIAFFLRGYRLVQLWHWDQLMFAFYSEWRGKVRPQFFSEKRRRLVHELPNLFNSFSQIRADWHTVSVSLDPFQPHWDQYVIRPYNIDTIFSKSWWE